MGGKKGFTIPELLIAIAIVVLLGMVIIPNYFSYRNQVAIEGEGGKLVAHLREALSRARSQQDGVVWAIDVSNGSSDYYDILSGGATGTSVGRIYLGSRVTFTATTSSSTYEITGGSTIAPLTSQIDIGLITTDGVFSEEISVGTNGKITRTKSY